MSTLKNEINLIQNEALGAACLYKFAKGYQRSRKSLEGTPFISFFVVLPMVLNLDLADLISSTNRSSGLTKFVEKARDSRGCRSQLYGLERQCELFREQTLEAIRIAIFTSLLTLDSESGLVYAGIERIPEKYEKSEIRGLLDCSEKLGGWFGTTGVIDGCSILRLEL